MAGLQTGVFNLAGDESEGFMLSFVNSTDSFSGLQIGFLNLTNHLNGLQIGILNIVRKKEKLPIFPIVNWSF